MSKASAVIELDIKEATRLARATLGSLRISESDKDAIVSHVIEAEARGYASHGLMRLIPIVSELQSGNYHTRHLEVDDDGFLFLNGAGSQGIAAVSELLMLAIDRLGTRSVVIAAASNYVGTTGCLGVYGNRLAGQGLIAIQICHSIALVAPDGALDPILGTNPFSISVPGSDFPFVADIATSVKSHGWARIAKLKGEPIPEGVIQDRMGNPSFEPEGPCFGSMLPMAGHKGFALGLAAELICGPVLGGKAGLKAVPGSDSYFSVVFKADIVRPIDSVMTDCNKLYEEILGARRKPGVPELRIPGQRASKFSDSIAISRELWEDLTLLGLESKGSN
jgi:L-2-hydroxycarboxylate dehydrogenase (NAD+)